MDVVAVALVALALGTVAYGLSTREWWAMVCDRCGRSLEGEAYAGPVRRWFATEGVMSVIAERSGWAEGLCPDCQREADDVR